MIILVVSVLITMTMSTTVIPAFADEVIDADAPATQTTQPAVPLDAGGSAAVEIAPAPVPQAVNTGWALFNLILTAVTVLIAIGLITALFLKHTEAGNVTKNLGICLIGVAAAATAIILFALTEDMSQTMKIADQWTLWHIVIIVAVILVCIFSTVKSFEAKSEW
jgi:hypothetical protein